LCKQCLDPAVPDKGFILNFGLTRVKAHGHVSKTREKLRDLAHQDTMHVSLPAQRPSTILNKVASIARATCLEPARRCSKTTSP
jgi:hypothetical protein